ncbi:hypothetical protein CSUB01_02150 [Colletotrichum sublineola]|uniref:Uncharacterized protein n=1 Tax=Colletotrichum sublineola TaxID=1173701 RepID=A0A066X3C3_COLSU|nr:hypothetical protein CSUB01_02150 [Colletotrichum sublineola]
MEAAGCKIVGGADGVLVNNLNEQLATLRPGPGGSVPTDRQLLDVKSRLCDYRFPLPVKARRHGAWAGLGWWGLDGNATWHLSYLGIPQSTSEMLRAAAEPNHRWMMGRPVRP